MAMSFVEKLAQSLKQAPVTRQDRTRAVLHALQGDIIAALEAGYSAKTVWRYLIACGEISVSYDTFLRHVKRARAAMAAVPASTAKPMQARTSPPVSSQPKRDGPVIAKAAEPPGFKWNPIPNRDELI